MVEYFCTFAPKSPSQRNILRATFHGGLLSNRTDRPKALLQLNEIKPRYTPQKNHGHVLKTRNHIIKEQALCGAVENAKEALL